MDEERRETVPKAVLSYRTFAIIHLCLPSLTFAIFIPYVPSISFILKSSFIFRHQSMHIRMRRYFQVSFRHRRSIQYLRFISYRELRKHENEIPGHRSE